MRLCGVEGVGLARDGATRRGGRGRVPARLVGGGRPEWPAAMLTGGARVGGAEQGRGGC
jgi:hypothetical protein